MKKIILGTVSRLHEGIDFTGAVQAVLFLVVGGGKDIAKNSFHFALIFFSSFLSFILFDLQLFKCYSSLGGSWVYSSYPYPHFCKLQKFEGSICAVGIKFLEVVSRVLYIDTLD